MGHLVIRELGEDGDTLKLFHVVPFRILVADHTSHCEIPGWVGLGFCDPSVHHDTVWAQQFGTRPSTPEPTKTHVISSPPAPGPMPGISMPD